MWTRRALFLGAAAAATHLLAADHPETRLRIEVTNHKGDPVERATVIVKFVQSGSIKRLGKNKTTKWELKTNQQGIANIPPLPQGKLMIQVIAKKYQTYGKYVEINEPESTVQVELNPPQPQYSAH